MNVKPPQVCLGVKNYFAGDPFAEDTFRLVVFRYGPAPIEYVEMAQWGSQVMIGNHPRDYSTYGRGWYGRR